MKILYHPDNFKFMRISQIHDFSNRVFQVHHADTGFVEDDFCGVGRKFFGEQPAFLQLNPKRLEQPIASAHILEKDQIIGVLTLPPQFTGIVLPAQQVMANRSRGDYPGYSTHLVQKCFRVCAYRSFHVKLNEVIFFIAEVFRFHEADLFINHQDGSDEDHREEKLKDHQPLACP